MKFHPDTAVRIAIHDPTEGDAEDLVLAMSIPGVDGTIVITEDMDLPAGWRSPRYVLTHAPTGISLGSRVTNKVAYLVDRATDFWSQLTPSQREAFASTDPAAICRAIPADLRAVLRRT